MSTRDETKGHFICEAAGKERSEMKVCVSARWASPVSHERVREHEGQEISGWENVLMPNIGLCQRRLGVPLFCVCFFFFVRQG